MTRILLTPLVKNAVGRSGVRARLTARPTYPYRTDDAKLTFSQILIFDFEEFQLAHIDLDPPETDSAWILTLTVAATVITRTVSFAGSSVEWDDLIDIDPATLEPLPDVDEIAAWEALRKQIEIEAGEVRVDVNRAIRQHVDDSTPHPAYDDIQDLVLVLENAALTGVLTDEQIPDLDLIFDHYL